MSTCLTLGVTVLAPKTEIQRVLYYQLTVGAPVCSDRASMYLQITLVLFKTLIMHIVSPSVESEDIAG